MRILLVEDGLTDSELTLEARSEAMFANEVTVVRNGAAALEHLRAGAGGVLVVQSIEDFWLGLVRFLRA